jgi:hypothetical protein
LKPFGRVPVGLAVADKVDGGQGWQQAEADVSL